MRRRTWRPGLLLLVAASLIAALIPIVFGRVEPVVHVAWQPMATAQRLELERRFRLADPVEIGGGRWEYAPLDTSRDTLQQLIADQRVTDTGGIDRNLFRLDRASPLSRRHGGLIASAPRQAPRLAKWFAALLGLAGAALILVAPRMRRFTVAETSAAVQRGIPVASAEAAAVFRIVFGTCVLMYVARNPVATIVLNTSAVSAAGGVYGELVRWLARHPALVGSLPVWFGAAGLLFVAGAATRITYLVFLAGYVVWASVYTLTTSHHVVAALGAALLCLLAAPWADAWSVDAAVTRAPHGLPSRRYGFVMWVPMFVLGVVFALAAASKLREGLDWILNGTVKYHFLSDLDHAWVPWGVWLTQYRVIAIAMSAAAVLIEAVVITAAFARSDRYRAAIGATGVALLSGFALFQGIVWPGWWILLLGFLPWHRIHARAAELGDLSLSVAQKAALCAFTAIQLFAAGARVEARPFLSAYDMYSTTYADDEEYQWKAHDHENRPAAH